MTFAAVEIMKPRRPHTPLLFILLGVTMFIAATVFVASHVEFTPRVLEPFVMTALVAAVGGTRIFVR